MGPQVWGASTLSCHLGEACPCLAAVLVKSASYCAMRSLACHLHINSNNHGIVRASIAESQSTVCHVLQQPSVHDHLGSPIAVACRLYQGARHGQ